MRRVFAFRWAVTSNRPVIVPALLLCLGLIGCNNSCVVFISNPGGSISTGDLACTPGQSNGSVRAQITSSLAPSAEDAPNRIQHIFVTLQGIEVNPSATADEKSPEWHELAPNLATQPAQLDLLANSADSREQAAYSYVAVPADAYRQIRLRLYPNQSESSGSILQENACGSTGFNCIVTSDGALQPLVLDSNLSQIQVSSDRIAGGFVRILPETTTELKIEFNPQSSLFIRTDEAVRLVPVFTVDSQISTESADAANR